jgi:hypothetical protein
MKRTTLSLLVVGLIAGVATSAIAQNVMAGNPPADERIYLTMAVIDHTKSKADYKAAKAKAQTEYKDAMAKCQSLTSNVMLGCMTDAAMVRTDALAQAKTHRDIKPSTEDMDNAWAQPTKPQ